MGTIAKLVVALEGDNKNLKSAFADSVRATQQFAGQVNVSSRRVAEIMKATGQDGVAAMRQAAAEMARDVNKVVPIASAAGFRAGQSMARTMSQGFAQGNAIANIRRTLGGIGGGGGPPLPGGGGFGGRTQTAVLASAFALAGIGDAIAASETKLTRVSSAVSSVLKTVSIFALAFGPKGWIVAGVATALSFVIDFFAKTRDEAARTAKSWRDNVNSMIDATDQMGLQNKLRDLQVGLPSAGRSPQVAGAFQGSMRELQGQIDIAQRNLEGALVTRNARVATVARRQIQNLEKQLKPLRDQERLLIDALLNPVIRRESRGLPSVEVTAPSESKVMSDLIARSRQLLSVEGQIVGLGGELLRVYDQIASRKDALRDALSGPAIELRKAMQEIEKNPVFQYLLGLAGIGDKAKSIGVGQTPAATADFERLRAAVRPIAPIEPVPVGQFAGLKNTLENLFKNIGSTLKSTLASTLGAAFGPVALLIRALEPALQVLYPLLDKLVAPLAAVAQIIVAGLEPALQALFPIVRTLAIVLSLVSEICSRAAAGIAQALGGLLVGIGNLLNKLPGSIGNPIKRLGQSLLTFAAGANKSADEMRAARKRLEGMEWGDTADSITGLGDAARFATNALLNVPMGYRVALDRFLATTAINANAPMLAGAGGGGSAPMIFQPGSIVINAGNRKPDALFREVAAVARAKSQAQYGTTVRAADTLAFPG